MLENTEFDIDYDITIQSLANAYKLLNGCYEDVYRFSGVVQYYISSCIVGGRCMTNSNRVYHVKGKMQTLMLVVYILLLCVALWGTQGVSLKY